MRGSLRRTQRVARNNAQSQRCRNRHQQSRTDRNSYLRGRSDEVLIGRTLGGNQGEAQIVGRGQS